MPSKIRYSHAQAWKNPTQETQRHKEGRTVSLLNFKIFNKITFPHN